VPIADDTIARIKDMILDGELTPGQRLPREADLAEKVGASRNALREAVRALAAMKILDVRQGDGTYVTSLDPSLLMEVMGFAVDFHQDDSVLHFLEVRRVMEPQAAALAAVRTVPSDHERLAAALAELKKPGTPDQFVERDIEFHRCIASGSKNPVLASLLAGLAAPTQRARIWRFLIDTSAVTRTVLEHQSICDAIIARQPDVASAWATVHIAGLEGALDRSKAATRKSRTASRTRGYT